jgi:alpha-L-arabinofuranosidase
MPIARPISMQPKHSRKFMMLVLAALPPILAIALVWIAGVHHPLSSNESPQGAATPSSTGVTNIAIGTEVLHQNVQRFGINLSGQTFYDSGQMMKNLTFRNPGFEGETWQSFLHCKAVEANTCTDENRYSPWPAGFLDNAHFEVLSGKAAGQTGTVQSSSAAAEGHGIVLRFASPPQGLAADDFLLVRMDKPGNAAAGWWTSTNGGASIATEFHDLAPNSPGKQALRLDASGPNQYASVSSYFDSTEGRSFLQLRGRFTLRFRAKWLAGSHALPVSIARFDKARNSGHTFFQQDVALTPAWHDYTLGFTADEDGSASGTVALTFATQQNSFLLDDVVLTPMDTPANATAFRDEVVDTLHQLHPGILRFMDSGTSFGSTLDDLLAPPFARRRGGWHLSTDKAEDIPIGLHESLALAQAVHADPWYTVPGTLSPAEMSRLIEYLAGPANTPYGARRAALGQAAPWTSVFHTIHLELGNEMWNAGDFGGEALFYPAVYAARASSVFSAAHASPWFDPARFDLIAGAQAGNAWLTTQLLKTDNHANSIDFAPYLFGQLSDTSSNEAIFGAMFSMPEQQDMRSSGKDEGLMAQQVRLAQSATHPALPEIYEVNLSTNVSSNNNTTQAKIDEVVPSIGGALAVADHMLLMLRELGITSQCLFALPGYANRFTEPDNANKTTPLWGAVIDMGGPTNLRRPTYYALQLMNQALLRDELKTQLSGADPTWDQPASQNGPTPATRAHLLQIFAFAEGPRKSLILINLSRSSPLPVTFSGLHSPHGTVTESRLTSKNIADTNERQRTVFPVTRKLPAFNPGIPYPLPPFSMTVLTWEISG